MSQTPSLSHWLIILALGAIWGSAFMAMELALDGFGPLWVAALRTSLAAPLLWTLLLVSGSAAGSKHGVNAFRHMIAAGVIGMALPFFLLSWGQQHVPSAFAGIAMGSLPIVLIPLAYIFLPGENLSTSKIVGLLVGFLGLSILLSAGEPSVIESNDLTLGRVSCIAATLCYAVASIITRRSPDVPALLFSSVALSVAAMTLLPLALLIEGVPNDFPWKPTLAVAYAAVFPTALAAYWRVVVIKSVGSVFMSLVAYLVPVFSIFFGVVFLKESLVPQTYFAVFLILLGIAFSQLEAIRQVTPKRGEPPAS